jgi:hypothetical protein
MEALLIDIPLDVRIRLKEIADRQEKSSQTEVVYRNQLAVYTTYAYMQYMGVPVDLENSYSQSYLFQKLSDTGALLIHELGHLECRPVAHGAANFYIPEDVWGDRIGYVAVQLNTDQSEAKLLGFVKAVDCSTVPLSQLEPIATLLDYLEQVEIQTQEQPEKVLVSHSARLIKPGPINRLSQWLGRTFESGWQLVEDLQDEWAIAQAEPAIAFRQAPPTQSLVDAEVIQCGKTFKFHEQDDQSQLRLLVGFRPQVADEYEVRVRLTPTQTPYLMPGIKLFLLDDTKAEVFQAQTRAQNDFLQFIFSGGVGDEFSIKIAHENMAFEEAFVIDP